MKNFLKKFTSKSHYFLFTLFLLPMFLMSGCSGSPITSNTANTSNSVTNQTSKQQQASLDLQAKCADQAKKVFATFKPIGGMDTWNYTNHYNSNGTCYVLVHGFGEGGTEDGLLNAYENTNIAQCDSYAGASKINFCSYRGVSEKYDLSKFNSFVKSYMEN